MAKGMKTIAWLSILITIIAVIIYQAKPFEIIYTTAITAGTIAYHFWMRLFVGGVFNFLLNNKVDYNKKWFRVGKAEQKLYRILKVKKWKQYFPTYDKNAFDRKQHSWNEIAQAMCQSELVHETIAVLSFLPILSSRWFGATLVFVLTSIFSALFDLTFVMIQRYNRPRVLKLLSLTRR
ncbi:MAG: hypothetical protein IJC17_04525 [Clostridia bacterium]|nr:hypothetical protein [Clostridia bacterium]